MYEGMKSIIDKAKATFSRVRVTGGACASEIESLEMLIKHRIPGDYRFFLENYGTLGFHGLEIYGLIRGNLKGEGPPNTYFMTESDLRDNSIPGNSLVVASTGYGPVILLDSSTNEVYGWGYKDGSVEEIETFNTFEEFMIDAVSTTLSDFLNDADDISS